MKLQHLSLPASTPYLHASSLQDRIVRAFLDAKPSRSSPATLTSNDNVARTSSPPRPTLITFTPPPTYTCGRREISRLAPSQIAHLTAPTPAGTAGFFETLRGGQTTYHGPGQLVAYPILDLKSHGLSARCYVNLLEEAVIRTLAAYGVRGIRTENPGVWTERSKGIEKICAVGVHLRRNISSHGIGLNVGREPLPWLGRIVACGLEGKGAASLETEGVEHTNTREVGDAFAQNLSSLLQGLEGVEETLERDCPL